MSRQESGPASVLVVEDNEVNRELLVRRLERSGFLVHAVQDGLAAIEAVARQRPDLVLMDLGLPVVDGWEATRRIKAETGGAVAVIALTAHAMQGDRERALAAGCDDYATKPVDMPRLLDQMHALLARGGRR